ncbi:DUF2809 domain-containing protein [Mesonia sp.]|uniref:ribosomal maturation YjgA family protein n=1 Tax=Mesonia sp. TaxID=1960830 RepID=UPI0017760B00|nr:DUF2809 domain-containing protein [Mesonia sp.]HIB36683.1 DUF2809 domain-containing protein [Mesonia sp.]HIO26946.1 DUF2809 domain-containing protein [Flavobacteriaceae bacterium]
MLKFRYTYFMLFMGFFLAEVAIERYFHVGFIRGVFGDYLIIFVIYCFLLSFLKLKKFYVAIAVLILAYTIEIAQYLNILALLKVNKSRSTDMLVGSSFDWRDMAAYTLGFLTILGVEKLLQKKNT